MMSIFFLKVKYFQFYPNAESSMNFTDRRVGGKWGGLGGVEGFFGGPALKSALGPALP